MSTSFDLAAHPRSVGRARSWVVALLATIGRPDLADAAELGVSELVTNAILHGRPPIVVRLGGTHAHPRVEVHDTSMAPPRVHDMRDDDRLLTTVGRGLGIVARCSATWGTEVCHDGKVVWFEPAAEAELSERPDARSTGVVFDFSELVDDAVAAGEPEQRLTVRLLSMPVDVFAHSRVWYADLRRELSLIALSHPHDYPIAQELLDLALQVERERRQAHGVDGFEVAMAAGHDRVDLEYHVPLSTPTTMQRLYELLDEVEVFCRQERMLTLPPSDQLAGAALVVPRGVRAAGPW